jgi:hypothetical protein
VRTLGNPPAIAQLIKVTFVSACEEMDIPEEGSSDEGEEMLAKRTQQTQQTSGDQAGMLPAHVAIALKGRLRLECVNRVSVSLDAGTTAGLKISEVTLGNDVFATNIAVNTAEGWTEVCDPAHCEEKTGSARVVDAAGAFVALIGGFRVCRCQT